MNTPLHSAYAEPGQSPGLALWLATNAWQRRIRSVLAPHELTHVQFVLLATLTWFGSEEPVMQRDLAERAGTDPMMTSQVVRVLERKGLLVRSPHPRDGRAVTVQPTGNGAELANRANRDVEAADAEYFGHLPVADREALVRYLAALPRD